METMIDLKGHLEVLQQLAAELTELGNIVKISEGTEEMPIPALLVFMDGEDESESESEEAEYTLEARLSLVQSGIPEDNGLLVLAMFIDAGISLDLDEKEGETYSEVLALLPMINSMQTMGHFNIMPEGSIVYRNTFIGRAEDGFDASAIDELIDYSYLQVLHYGEIIFDLVEGNTELDEAVTAIMEGPEDDDWDDVDDEDDNDWYEDDEDDDEDDNSDEDGRIRPIR